MNTSNIGTILYIGGFELPDKNAAAQRVLANAKLFREVGYEIILLGAKKNIEYDTPIITTLFKYDGFSMYSVAYPKTVRQWMDYLTNANKYIEFAENIKNLKCIICYNFPSIALEKIRQYCVKSNIKCIADVTEWYSGKSRVFPINLLKNLDTFYRMRIVQKKMDALIVISRYLEQYYSGCNNVIYIPPLTDLKYLARNHTQKTPKKELRLVYAGSPRLKDQINLLIEALSRVKRNVRLDIIGIDELEYLSIYPEHRNRKMLTSNIVFHGRLSHSVTLDYVRNADFSCFFRYEDIVTKAGFPTKFTEAISLGTPVLTNRSSNIDEYIHNDINGVLVKTLDIDEIARTIETLSTNIRVDVDTFCYQRYVISAKRFLEKYN